MSKTSKTLQAKNKRLASAYVVSHDTKPIPKPSAQIKTLCDDGQEQDATTKRLLELVTKMKPYSNQLYYIAVLMIEGSLRVSEALAIEPRHITASGKVLVKSLKKGEERLISAGDAKEFLLKCRNVNRIPFEGCSRFWVYREFKKFGIQFQSSTSSKASVTHAIRHIITASNRTVTNSNQVLAKELGHRNLTTNQRYGKSKQAKKN
jgi:integrase